MIVQYQGRGGYNRSNDRTFSNGQRGVGRGARPPQAPRPPPPFNFSQNRGGIAASLKVKRLPTAEGIAMQMMDNSPEPKAINNTPSPVNNVPKPIDNTLTPINNAPTITNTLTPINNEPMPVATAPWQQHDKNMNTFKPVPFGGNSIKQQDVTNTLTPEPTPIATAPWQSDNDHMTTTFKPVPFGGNSVKQQDVFHETFLKTSNECSASVVSGGTSTNGGSVAQASTTTSNCQECALLRQRMIQVLRAAANTFNECAEVFQHFPHEKTNNN
jgi:hypothetical protein